MPFHPSVVGDIAAWPPEILIGFVVLLLCSVASQLCFASTLSHDSVANGHTSLNI